MLDNHIKKKISFAIVGCGRISKNHIKAIYENSEIADLVAICDNDKKALDKTKSYTNAKSFNSLSSLLNNIRPDIVTVTTPSGLHCKNVVEIANAGINVITEKPMATNLIDAETMIQTCYRNNVKLFVVKQNRFNPTIKLLKDAIDLGRFGKIFMVNINVFWTRPQNYYDLASWRGTWKYDGGAYLNQASHYMDLAQWLFGPISMVNAFTDTLARNIEAEDTGVLNVKWESGALGSINTTMLTYPENYEGSITVIGEKGTVKVGGIALNKIEHWKFKDQNDSDLEVRNNNYVTNSVYGNGHTIFYKKIIQSLKGNKVDIVEGKEGLKSLKFILAAYESSKKGKIVKL